MELKADLPSGESIYSARSVDDASEAALKETRLHVHQLDKILEMLFSKHENKHMPRIMEDLGILSNFIVIAGN
jgi:hypothetical protein